MTSRLVILEGAGYIFWLEFLMWLYLTLMIYITGRRNIVSNWV